MELALGAITSLAPKLGELLMVEYVVQMGLKPDIESVSRELVMIQAGLYDASRVPPDQLTEVEKLWPRHVRVLSYDMEDIVESFILHMADGESANATAANASVFKRILSKAAAVTKKVKDRYQISDKVKDIKMLSNEFAELRAKYRFRGAGADLAMSTGIDPRVLNLYKKESDLIGIAESRGKVIKMLIGDGAHVFDRSLKIVSIVGIAGLGKTTLARTVFDMLKAQFEYCAFVSIGRTPSLTRTFEKILVELDYQKYEQVDMASWDIERSSNELRNFLQDKRYFMVIDDLWDISSWKVIADALGKNNNGSRIIVTTRIFQAGSKAGEIYRMKPLSYIDSKRLFHKRIFGCDEEDFRLFEACEKVIKISGGVPLAIIAAASKLVERPIEDWLKVTDTVFPGDISIEILSYSYYDLPHYLQPCLLFLSIYPEDYFIEKKMLIWRWIAEGFVYGNETNELFELGESYFNELINRSLIQPVEIKDTGLVYGCQVHSMVLQLICSLSCYENFVCLLNGDERGQITFRSRESRRYLVKESEPRWLAIHNRKEGHNFGDDMDLHKLRSLTAIECPIYMIPPVFSYKLLRVLDLESCGSMEGYDLKHLAKLLLLRFIGLRNTFVRMLPEELGHLKILQTLDLQGSGVEDLPTSIGELTSLMCLNADWTTRVADWIGKLTSLQQLVMYPGGGNDDHSIKCFVTGLRNLRELRDLRFLIKAYDEEQLSDLLETVLNLPKIEVLHFDFYGVQLKSGIQFEPACFGLSKNLRFLELPRLEFSRLPSWITAQDLPHLCHLSMMLFDVDEQDLENLGRFTKLSYLNLLIVNIESGDANIICASGAFQNLKFCSITKPFRFPQGVMPSLEVLDFHFNVRLLSGANNNLDFFGLGNLPSLQKVIVQVNCLYSFPGEDDQAEAALWNAINVHPNSPILDISLYGQRMKKTLVGDLKLLNRPKLEKKDNYGVNKTPNSDKGKGVVVAQEGSKSAYYKKSLSLALDGIDEPTDELIKRLSMVDHNAANNKKMRILSIVRSEGLGKTTLAQKVFDKLSPEFDCAAFVLVGQNPDMRKVLADILISSDKENYEDFPVAILDIMDLIGLIRKSLKNNRFFVVVDDIWDLKAWDMIKCALIENNNGSAVLKTASRQNWDRLNWTASEENDKSHFNEGRQSGLLRSSTDFIKEFFYKKLFESEDECPPYLKDICEKLIEICDGLLSVVDETVELLGSVPRTLKDWQAVYDRRKLALSSYPSLPDCNKKCLQYFCMFRQGYEISAERLVWAWIAQGFVHETEGEKDLKKVGMGYLRELIEGKMIEAVKVDADGMALSCRVYDLVHDFIISKSTEENFIAILNDQKSNDRAVPATVHGLSIQGSDSQPKLWFSKVKSLVAACDNLPPMSGFGDLLVMDLGACDSLQVGHLKGISKTTSLEYLAIGGKCIADIPREIAKLKHLRTLDLSASGLSELPQCVLLLSELERLFVNIHMKIPDGIAKMSALQELGDINIVEPMLLEKLCKLSQLRVLRIALWSWDEGKSSVEAWWDTLHSLLGSCKNIESLCILTFCSLDFMDGSGDKWPPQTLKNLAIRHSAFHHHKLPSWFDSLAKVSSLTIEVNKLSKDITDTLGKLPALCSLSLTSKQMPEGVYFVIDTDTFKKLQSLKFVCNAMVGMFVPQSNGSQQLRRLTLVFQVSCTRDINKDFRFGLDNLRSLEHIRVEINCFNASNQMVKVAEDAILKEFFMAGSGSSQPNLEIRRLEEENMIEEEDQTTGHQVARTTSLSTMKTMQSKPVIGQAPLYTTEVASKVPYHNISNNTFLKNVGILMSTTKTEKWTERMLQQEQTTEQHCSIASHQMVSDAEDAIRKELSRAGCGNSQPNLEIRRLEKESMIAEDNQTTGHQVARTSTLKTEGNDYESDSMDLFESTTKTIQAEYIVVGPAPMSSVDVVSKVLYHNSSNNTCLKNFGIPRSSMKIEKSTEPFSQELATEKHPSTTLLVELDKLKKKSDVTEQALSNTQRELVNTQREFEEFKKQMEENNLLLKRILQLNNAGIS